MKAVFHNAVNMRAFDYAALLDGAFSDQTSTGFTLTSGGEVINVTGTDFFYAGGNPVDGTIFDIDATFKGHFDFSMSGLELSVPQLQTDLANHDTGALRADFFGGSDKIIGSNHADVLAGFDGDDRVAGRNGDDLLIGGDGHDKLIGGADRDTFRFDSVAEAKSHDADLIVDLQDGDLIDLSRIDADTTTDGDQAFTLVDQFTHQAGQATLDYDLEGDRTYLSLDVDGDGHADGRVLMVGDHVDFTSFVL